MMRSQQPRQLHRLPFFTATFTGRHPRACRSALYKSAGVIQQCTLNPLGDGLMMRTYHQESGPVFCPRPGAGRRQGSRWRLVQQQRLSKGLQFVRDGLVPASQLSTLPRSSATSATPRRRMTTLALGGHFWSTSASSPPTSLSMVHEAYAQTIQTSLERGMTVIEVPGTAAGEQALMQAHQIALQRNPMLQQVPVTFLLRVGYRIVVTSSGAGIADKESHDVYEAKIREGDVWVEEFNNSNNQERPGALNGMDDQTEVGQGASAPQQDLVSVYHNISPAYLQSLLVGGEESSSTKLSPLVRYVHQLVDPKNDNNDDASSLLAVPNARIRPMLHNPEEQGGGGSPSSAGIDLVGSSGAAELTLAQRRAQVKERVKTAMSALEDIVNSTSGAGAAIFDGFGVVSNGLGLPPHHALHLSWPETIQPAAMQSQAASFKAIQLPINVVERLGLQVAKNIRKDILDARAARETTTTGPLSPLQQLQIFAMRPIACLLDRGTGREAWPIVLADVQVPATLETTLESMRWTHELEAPPEAYTVALTSALQHFDAEDLRSAQLSGKTLTSEERETLDGCKLMQNLLQDVDAGLVRVRSIQAHEREIMHHVIPLLHDTFEGYDEQTADVLQRFFATHRLAVQHAVPRNVRRLLTFGETDGEDAGTTNLEPVKDLSSDMRLQEYALRYVLQEPTSISSSASESSNDATAGSLRLVDTIVVGGEEPSHVVDLVDTLEGILSSSTNAPQ